jgi:maltose/maltodextrin transport system substrate-binding protein/arabinogalactan oligomer/maltooligosaccharide transport system substrate-binding protein
MSKSYLALAVGLIAASMIILGSACPPLTSAQEAELVIWVRDDYPISFEEVGAEFQEDFELSLRVEVMPMNVIRERFPGEAAGENGPDIIADSDEFVPGYVEGGLIAPVHLGNRATEYIPFAVEAFSTNGQLYALPYALENLALVRNTDLVPDAPQTWAEVHDISRQLQEQGAVQYGFVLQDYDFYHFYPILSAFGGYVFGFGPEGTFNVRDTGLNNEGAVAALTWTQQMTNEGLMPVGLDWNTVHDAFETGRAAMLITGPWAIERLDGSGVPYAVSPIPSGTLPGRPWVHVLGFMINAHSDQKEVAQAFLLEYLSTEDNMDAIFENVYRLPAHMAVFERIDDPVMLGFAAAVANGQRFPGYLPEMQPVWDIYTNAVQQVREGRQDPQTAADEAVNMIRDQIGG